MRRILAGIVVVLIGNGAFAAPFSVAVFEADVTPPEGAPLCGGAVAPVAGVDDPLLARGIVLTFPDRSPVVLCAVDWVGIANGGHDAWRNALARAADTTPDRVSVHTLHQHDAPFCDFSSEALMAEYGYGGVFFDVNFAYAAIARTADALSKALPSAQPVTHVGVGEGLVEGFASNRRVDIGPDGKVQSVRWTATKDPRLRALPDGVIDPMVRVVSLWRDEQALAVLTYYASHPQSHYGKGQVSCDTVGLARGLRDAAVPGVPHIHFAGAGGNIGAGKYNDGSPEKRPLLAQRLAAGMEVAWTSTEKTPLSADDARWTTTEADLPVRSAIDLDEERRVLVDPTSPARARGKAAREIAWMERRATGKTITLGLLTIGDAMLLHLPGELFVEYQLAASEMAPDATVCVAAYGDYGPGYIGTEKSYDEGGYETQLHVSRTDPTVEQVLLGAMQRLLE
jgi:hypothetical protein